MNVLFLGMGMCVEMVVMYYDLYGLQEASSGCDVL
jgi:hypothetical protein